MRKVTTRTILLACLGACLLSACDDGGGGNGGADAGLETDADGTTETAADGDAEADAESGPDVGLDALPGDVTVRPARIEDVLTNPGMGFADFHFGWWCNLPPVTFSPAECAARVEEHWPENYPDAGTAYFRWNWRELEPIRGAIDFDLIDTTLRSANALGETLGFRVMTIAEGGRGVPDWLLEAPYAVPGREFDGTFWPDYRDATFQEEHRRFWEALGARYDDHPALDHVDIGSVGCWGEWNTACLSGVEGLFEVFDPADDEDREEILAAYEGLIDQVVDAFPTTPTVMLGQSSGWELRAMMHAIERGAGWRVDCWGDWGLWSWGTHMEDLYPAMIANATAADPDFPDTWRHAPIQLEICGTVAQWHDELGWTADAPDGEIHRTFQWALDQHASVVNGKSGPIPADYVPAMNDLLRRNGYRFALDVLNHPGTVRPGAPLTFVATWSNLGVAPAYRPRALTYRLRNAGREVRLASATDITTWLPGTHLVRDEFVLPGDVEPGVYAIEVALLDRAGTEPETTALPPTRLAMEGRGTDGWYALSELTVAP
ncbi:MAG: DUF4832 domain-containing protein [Deltaproteobacteria bacterium]|nr:DUF4832 domain-containing protein [Deltaproteobacteria bacterium]